MVDDGIRLVVGENGSYLVSREDAVRFSMDPSQVVLRAYRTDFGYVLLTNRGQWEMYRNGTAVFLSPFGERGLQWSWSLWG